MLWCWPCENYSPPGNGGSSKIITLELKGTASKHATISRVDSDHGDVRAAYKKMDSPNYPMPEQILELRKASELSAPEIRVVAKGNFTVILPAQGLAVIELK